MNKKIVTIQDISCYGQCSITVALPVLSAYGFETAILPSAVLSTHTGGFKNFTVCDLSNEIPKIINHWKNEGIKFDALYSGYLGDEKHIDMAIDIKNNLLKKGSPFILDPVMGDNGKLYPAFNNNYVDAMKRLVKEADVILPNLTEASLLTGIEYKEQYDKEYVKLIISELKRLGAKNIIITGISYRSGYTGVEIYDGKELRYFEHKKIEKSFHGTGDVYSSTFVANYLKNDNLYLSSQIAAEFVVECIKATIDDKNHWYGVKFEPLLVPFISKLK